jgi:anhydro-N-acetylmuramic acid kinase
MKKFKVLGLMSGTSLDGLDLAYCTFSLQRNRWRFEIDQAVTVKYTAAIRRRLLSAETAGAAALAETDAWFGRWMGIQARQFLLKYKLKPDLLASHGHTIFHQPEKGFSLQIGSGAYLAAQSGLLTVCDFRSGDVALGGQGAPLVPIGDELLFGDYNQCLNLGGIANISYKQKGKRIAFDICPVNLVLNFLSEKLNKSYDKGGRLAAGGKLIPGLLNQLNAAPFFHTEGPKSLGKEWVIAEVIPVLQARKEPLADILHTYCRHIATQIAYRALPGAKNMLVTGGGAYNTFLLECVREVWKGKLVVPGDKIIQFREALIFAFLGLLRVQGKTNCLRSVTGASRDSIGGCMYEV